MDPLPGFLSAPRLAGLPRTAGAFFSAVVTGSIGPGVWKITMEGRTLVVSTNLHLVPGQSIRLKLNSQQGARWLFQIVPNPSSPGALSVGSDQNSLMAAFLSRGLPLASERLSLWSRWVSKQTGPSDKEFWAASLESRGAGPSASLTQDVSPWLAWQAALEDGRSEPPPDDESCWEEWNLQSPKAGDPWLVVPLRWEYGDQVDSGLLQAHWNPQIQAVDRWHLTAAPAGTPFRLEAKSRPGRLDLIWRFFNPDDLEKWQSWIRGGPIGFLSSPDLIVTIEAAGKGTSSGTSIAGGINVEA